ncbi:MAG TPA: peptidylprolyl isomerase [bacterium]|nr:peptidylprolyl isomerase [bacterium]
MRGSHRWSTLVCSVATLSLTSLALLAGPVAAQDNKTAPAESREVKPKPEVAVDPAAPYKHITFAKGEKPRVVVETTMGKMVLELWPDVAPKHCQSFVYLVGKHYYDSVSFHRIIPGFVIQGGDPQGTGMGGPGYTIPAEFSDTLKHDLGILSMARTPDPNSAGSQFFICLSRERTKNLDKQYTIFGKVVEGLDVVEAIGKVKTGPGDRPVTPVLMTKVYMEPKG